MPSTGHHLRRAFTLLELILVLVLLGVLAALAAARLNGLRDSQGLDQAAQQVINQTLRCQQLASSGAQVVKLSFDLDQLLATTQIVDTTGAMRDPSDGHDAQIALWSGATKLTAAYNRDDGTVASSGIVDLMFYPDAVCDSPGLLVLANGERRTAVRCRPGAEPPSIEVAP